MEAEQARLAGAGLAAIEERDTTCCYARQDKFWVQSAPDGERWEIYTVLQDSTTFWGEDGGPSRDAAAAQLDAAPRRPEQCAACAVLRLRLQGRAGPGGSRHLTTSARGQRAAA